MIGQAPCRRSRSTVGFLSEIRDRYLTYRERRQRGAAELSRIKRSDLVLFSPGNSGRTWLRVMLTRMFELHYDLDSGPPIRFDNRHKLDPRVPKIAVTHNRWLPYFKIPRALEECKPYYSSTVLILVRNPLDTCVSQYFQWLHRSKDENIRLKGWPSRKTELSLQDFLRHPNTGVERLCLELNMWLRESVKFNKVMIVRYEDMLQNPSAVLKNISRFLEIDPSTKIIQQAVEFGSFENMQRRESTDRNASISGNENAANLAGRDAFKSRRGEKAGYSKYLSQEECTYFEQMIALHLSHAFGYFDLPEIRPMIGSDGEAKQIL